MKHVREHGDRPVQRSATPKTVVQVTDELCGHRAAALRRAVVNQLMGSPSPLALDLSGVTRIDGSGIDALASAAAMAGESDISLCLVGAQAGPVAAALADADLTELFDIFASVDEYDDTPDARIDVGMNPGARQ